MIRLLQLNILLKDLAIIDHTNLYGAVVGIEEEFAEGGDLWRTVPAVGAVDENWPAFCVDGVDHDERRPHQTANVYMPLGVLQ